jgi:hypothetical protein
LFVFAHAVIVVPPPLATAVDTTRPARNSAQPPADTLRISETFRTRIVILLGGEHVGFRGRAERYHPVNAVPDATHLYT